MVTFAIFGIGLYLKDVNTQQILIAIGCVFAFVTIVAFFPPYIQYITSEFGVTNRRVIIKRGLIRRKSLEVLLNMIEGIQVDQSVLGRILGFGSIVVIGAGGTKDLFHNISAPLEFRKKAQEQIVSFQDSLKRS
jgi:uncharacterized membrane protein YdbT with pleckstrin-like domain